MNGVFSRFRGGQGSGPDGITEEELADVVVHLHDYAGLSFRNIAACTPRDVDQLRDYYDNHPMAGSIEPPSAETVWEGGR